MLGVLRVLGVRDSGMTVVLPRLYAIVDADLCQHRGVDPRGLAAAYVAGGARLLQVRQKNTTTGALLALARAIVAVARGAGARVIVNDRADVAVMAGADGVHVGQRDLAAADARAIAGHDAIIGVSTHTEPQIDAAAASPADYLAVGPVFQTVTKDTGYAPRGLDLVRYASRRGKPVVAIGGITLENVRDVLAAGASSIAVISDLLTEAPDARVRDYLAHLSN